MSEEAQKLLMMLINDVYSQSGRIKKKTGLALMRFVGSDDELQSIVNNGDERAILNYRLKDNEPFNQTNRSTD